MTSTQPVASDQKILLIKAKGGFGNRMLSAVTGLIVADLTGRHPVIDWRDGVYAPFGQNAYPQLFDTPLTSAPQDHEAATSVDPEIWRGNLDLEPAVLISRTTPDKLASPTIYRKSCIDLARPDTNAQVAVYWSYLPKFGRIAKHLRRDPRFAGRDQADIVSEYLGRYFTPNTRVRTEVASFMAGLPRPVIGVHVRYTDRKLPLGKIMEQVRRRRDAMPGASLFLATDNAFVQEEMTRAFGKVYFTEKYLPEDGAQLHAPQARIDKLREAENAMIDMWALGACDHLIYSKNSTFSISSALIGNLRTDQQEDIDRFNPRIVIKRLLQPYI